MPHVSPTLRAGGNKTGGDRPPGTDVDTADSLIPVLSPGVVGTLRTRRPGEGGVQGDFDHIVPVVSPALNTQSGSHHAPDTKAYVAYAVTPFDTTQISSPHNYSNPQPGDPCHPLAAGAHPPAVAYPINTQMALRGADTSNTSREGVGIGGESDPAFTLQAGHSHAVAYDMRGREGGAQFEGPHDTANIRAASGGSSRSYVAAAAVRRLTPVECERLQGFPDNFTAIPWRKKGAEDCPDGPRYKALGNSMAVPVMRWIGERIAQVDAIKAKGDAA